MEKTQKQKDVFCFCFLSIPESSWHTASLRLALQRGLGHLVPVKPQGPLWHCQGHKSQVHICWWLVQLNLFGCLDLLFKNP